MLWLARIGLWSALLSGVLIAGLGLMFGVWLGGIGPGEQWGYGVAPVLLGLIPLGIAVWCATLWWRGRRPGWGTLVMSGILALVLIIPALREGRAVLAGTSDLGPFVAVMIAMGVGLPVHVGAARALLR